ncbi:MAG TPA: hypothetical protein PLA17_06615 [Bacteroidales bacterium]|nr:hypothetical protein [Bacteroidales bacterium]HPK85124.1 hypothetical protein [Bacteroidales bacterium]
MKKKINLPENHIRSLSSSLRMVEDSLVELEVMLLNQSSSCCSVVHKDVDEETIESCIAIIQEAKDYICELSEKYGTLKENLSLQRIINAKRTIIWGLLKDSLSRRMKGYGTFPKEHAGEYDADINRLIEITNKLNC